MWIYQYYEILQTSFNFFKNYLHFSDDILHLSNSQTSQKQLCEQLLHPFNGLRRARIMLVIPASLKYSFKCLHDDDDTFI